MLSCLTYENTTTSLTFDLFENVRAQSGLKGHARSSKNEVFFENVKEPAEETKTCWMLSDCQTALSRHVDCMRKYNIIGATKTFMLRPARCDKLLKNKQNGGQHGSVARFITVRIVCKYSDTRQCAFEYLQTLMTCMCIVKGKHGRVSPLQI